MFRIGIIKLLRIRGLGMSVDVCEAVDTGTIGSVVSALDAPLYAASTPGTPSLRARCPKALTCTLSTHKQDLCRCNSELAYLLKGSVF